MSKIEGHKIGKSTMEQLREIRDKISLETQDMTYEELRTFIDNSLTSTLYPKEVWKKKDTDKK